jgi:chromatin remodeling complex protein RSC6
VAKKVAKKAAPKKKTKRKANAALMKAMMPSTLLAEIVGAKPAPRGQITKKIWDYIKKNGLQDKINKRLINADEKLKKIFGGKSVVNMFEMTKHVSKHIS